MRKVLDIIFDPMMKLVYTYTILLFVLFFLFWAVIFMFV